nr:ankyrin domain repeat containing protein [Hymenolepis microstoma]
MSNCQNNSDEEFFDCTEPFPSKFYAVAVPRSSPGAGLFSSIAQAKSRLKSVKGSRLKAFCSIQEASIYSTRPVSESVEKSLPVSEGEATKFPSIKQQDLVRLRKYIEANDIERIKECVADNPMFLITGCDTPTILQLVFRFNAIHIAAKAGRHDVIKLIISYIESLEFWARIYPNADARTAENRRQRVLDLYLNSPETGCMSSPLHIASKFGHVECVRVLANHPTTILDLRDHLDATALESACNRLLIDSNCPSLEEKSLRKQAIVRALDERYVVLVDRRVNSDIAGSQPIILPHGLMGRQLHNLLAATDQLSCPGVTEFCPHLVSSQQRLIVPFTSSVNSHQTPTKSCGLQNPTSPPSPTLPFSPRRVIPVPISSVSMSPNLNSPIMDGSPMEAGVDLREYGASGQLVLIRAILGPLNTEEAKKAVTSWKKPRNPFWVNLRMVDAEKGYERFGRRLAKEFNTNWTEHWSFLDDFADLQSPYGLGLLNDYLAQLYTTDAETFFGLPVGGKLDFDDSFAEGNAKKDDKDSRIKKTPIKRVKCDEILNDSKCLTKGKSVINGREKDENWTAYREENNPEHVLNDSLDDTASSSGSSNDSTYSHDTIGGSKPLSSQQQVSPVVSLLSNFTVNSPLRLLLPPPCIESMFIRPERRISMFDSSALSTSNLNASQGSTPLKSTTGRTQKPLKSLSSRRHIIGGVWPSILYSPKSGGIREQRSHLMAAISTAELGAHNAIGLEMPPGDTENADDTQEVDLEGYPFVKRWKRELDLTFQQP